MAAPRHQGASLMRVFQGFARTAMRRPKSRIRVAWRAAYRLHGGAARRVHTYSCAHVIALQHAAFPARCRWPVSMEKGCPRPWKRRRDWGARQVGCVENAGHRCPVQASQLAVAMHSTTMNTYARNCPVVRGQPTMPPRRWTHKAPVSAVARGFAVPATPVDSNREQCNLREGKR